MKVNRIADCCSTRHHARRSPSTSGCHTHSSHSHTSTPGSSPLHAPAGLLSPHRAVPISHVGQTITSSPHRLSIGSSTTTTAGNGSPTSQSAPTPASASALTNVGIELNEMQPGELSNLQITANYVYPHLTKIFLSLSFEHILLLLIIIITLSVLLIFSSYILNLHDFNIFFNAVNYFTLATWLFMDKSANMKQHFDFMYIERTRNRKVFRNFNKN